MLIGASEGLSSKFLSDDIKNKYYLNTAASLAYKAVSEMKNLTKNIFKLFGFTILAHNRYFDENDLVIIFKNSNNYKQNFECDNLLEQFKDCSKNYDDLNTCKPFLHFYYSKIKHIIC